MKISGAQNVRRLKNEANSARIVAGATVLPTGAKNASVLGFVSIRTGCAGASPSSDDINSSRRTVLSAGSSRNAAVSA